MDGLSTPVLFIIFNRPEPTRRVFEEIRKARPARLFVAADAPRPDRPDEAELCRRAREAVQVDWPCRLEMDVRPHNWGFNRNITSAIHRVFEEVAEAIIIEDDCLPEPDFFDFCREMLQRHRATPRIMHVSGDNFQFGRRRGSASYYYSRYAHCWGWATWRRAWAAFEPDLGSFPAFAAQGTISRVLRRRAAQRYWLKLFRACHEGRLASWDFSWAYTLFRNDGLAVVPNDNLVSNIGFGAGATNTCEPAGRLAGLPTRPLGPLIHPEAVVADEAADDFELDHVFRAPLGRRLLDRFARLAQRRP